MIDPDPITPQSPNLPPWLNFQLGHTTYLPQFDLRIDYAKQSTRKNARRQARIINTSFSTVIWVSPTAPTWQTLYHSVDLPLSEAIDTFIARNAYQQRKPQCDSQHQKPNSHTPSPK